MRKVDIARAEAAFEAALIHSETCRRCSMPIIADAEGNPGYYGEACAVGLPLLVAYVRSIGETVPPAWDKAA